MPRCDSGGDYYDESKSGGSARPFAGGERLQGELKAELEIRHLHEKLDYLLNRQYNRLFEIQQIQIELLEEVSHHKR